MKRTELKRGKPLKVDPDKLREWKNRTAKRLPRASKQRRKDERERTAFREFVLKHRPRCEANLYVCTKRSTEVNELQRGPAREDCWLDYNKVSALCSNCHRWLTDHPTWALHHGHQLQHERELVLADWTLAEMLREFFATHLCHPRCPVDHRDGEWPPKLTVVVK